MKFFPPSFRVSAALRSLAAALIGIAMLAGCRGPALGGGLSPAERMMWSTYPLGTSKVAGTGLAVSMDQGGAKTALVTSAHVLETARKGPVFIALRTPDDSGHPQTILVQYRPPAAGGRYFVRHPTHDIAAFAVQIPPAAKGILSFPTCLHHTAIKTPNLHAGDQVLFAGYPDVMPYMQGVFPILRSGIIATYPAGTPEVNDMFCIDGGVHAGDSGAPVFFSQARGQPRLAGMILKRVVNSRQPGSHFAVAVNARAIRETLDLLQAQKSELPAALPLKP
jgi:hypothetical protein